MRYFAIFYCFKANMIGYGVCFQESKVFPSLVNVNIGTDQEIMVTNVYEFKDEVDYRAAQKNNNDINDIF
jgi:hypothetical protein